MGFKATMMKVLFGIKSGAIKYGPHIAFVFGTGAIIGAMASAMIDACDEEKTQPIRDHVKKLEELKDVQEHIEEHPETTLDAVVKERRKETVSTVGCFLGTFRKPIILGTVGIGGCLFGHLWLTKRYAATAGALAATAATLATVETNIAKTWGEDAVICLRDPNWDPEILRHSQEATGDSPAPVEGYYDPFREYAAKSVGTNPMLNIDANVVRFGPDTVEPGFRYDRLSSNLYIIRGAIDKAQADLDYNPACQFISRREMKERLHLTYESSFSDKRRILDDATSGWRKGDKIDANINGLFSEYSKNLDNPAWLDELNKRHEVITLKFNAMPGRLYDAFYVPPAVDAKKKLDSAINNINITTVEEF